MSGDNESESRNKEEPEIDTRSLGKVQLLAICAAQLNEAIQITMPYTLAVFMVRDFQTKDFGEVDEETVGTSTGLLAACFCAAQFLSSFPLGRLSDRFGRKKLLIVSNISSCISVILFGLSGNFLLAAVLRLLGGLFNCTFVCLKSMIGESLSTDAQARPLSILSLCWGLGTVIGPTLGGTLSRPCDTFGTGFPLCRNGQLFFERPFFLPCFIVGLVSFTAALFSIFIIKETLPAIVARKYQALQDSEEAAKQHVSHMPEVELSHLVENDPLANRISDLDTDQSRESANADTISSVDVENEKGDLLQQRDRNSFGLKVEGQWRAEHKLRNQLTKIEAEKELAIVWYKDRQTLLVISGYVMICLLYNLLDEMTPIYGSADREVGGLGFTTTQLAVPIVTGGISIFIWNLFCYTWYARVLGAKNACRLALLLSIPLSMLIGMPSLFPWGTTGLEIALAAVLFFKNICATNAFTSAVLMVNAVAPQKDLGSVNGASQASASLVRAIGPALGGFIWSISVSLRMQIAGFVLTGLGFLFPLIVFGAVSAPQVGKQ